MAIDRSTPGTKLIARYEYDNGSFPFATADWTPQAGSFTLSGGALVFTGSLADQFNGGRRVGSTIRGSTFVQAVIRAPAANYPFVYVHGDGMVAGNFDAVGMIIRIDGTSQVSSFREMVNSGGGEGAAGEQSTAAQVKSTNTDYRVSVHGNGTAIGGYDFGHSGNHLTRTANTRADGKTGLYTYSTVAIHVRRWFECTSRYVTVTGVPTGGSVEVQTSGDVLLGSPGSESGGSATVSMHDVALETAKKLVVKNSSGVALATYTATGDEIIEPGETYAATGLEPEHELEIAASLPALAASVSLDAGIPAPEAVTVNHPSQTQNVPFNVNWTAVTGADSYEVKYSKGGAAQVMLSAAAVGTSVVFSPTQTGTFVFYVRTNIDGEYSEQTASVTVTVAKQGKATFGKITILTAGTGNLSGEVTPDGTVRGVVVGIVQSLTPGGSVDEVSGVTYGGVAMQEVTALAHDHSEDGRIYLYFLGSGIPAGAQTVEVTASGTTAEKVAFIFTVHAGADTELHAFDTLSSGSVANPSDTLLLNGRTSFVGLFGFAGRDAVVNTAPLAGWTDSAEADQGSSVALAYRYLTVDGVDVTYGWTQAADDAAAIAFAVSAVGSAASAGGTGTGRIDGIDVIDQIGRI